MAIQRAAALPVPAPEVARARATLAPRYGALLWDGPDRRVLLVRVPGNEPDPVNDVEEAVEFLRPEDVVSMTHCLLVGQQSVAQVYIRPLQDLMRQREAFDRQLAAACRQRLRGLGHEVFQAPGDPRRRWRLAIRIPGPSVRGLDEAMLEEVAEGLGPQLETPRVQQVCGVYIIADEDDVRLEPDVFLQQMTATWQDEERLRRAELSRLQRLEQERRQKEEERRRVVAEMERAMARRTLRADRTASAAPSGPPARHAPARRGATPWAESTAIVTARPEVRHVRQQVDRLPRGPWVPEEAVDPGHGGTPANEGTAWPGAAWPAAAARSSVGPADPPTADAPTAALLETAQQQGQAQAQVADRVDELRARVDRAVAAPGRRSGKSATARRGNASAPERTRMHPAPAGAGSADRRAGAPHAPGLERARSVGSGRPLAPSRAADLDPAAAGRTPSPRLAAARAVLEARGFEVLESPSTVHDIDLAGERPDGEPQRVVVRVVDRLDARVAQGLLKAARELDVDLVLCVAADVDAEARRSMVATKIRVVSPVELASLRL